MDDNEHGNHLPEWINEKRVPVLPADGVNALDIDHTAIDSLVDFELANSVAKKLMRPGPQLSKQEMTHVVGELRRDAAEATGHVGRVTGLRATPGERVLVVDRSGWVKANTDAFRTMLAPAVTEALSKRKQSPAALAVGRVATGTEVGGLLSFLGSKVLGQYDISGGGGRGRLLLVAPNIVEIQRELDVDAADFRLWVALHEETHRVQFEANPWLRPYLLAGTRALATDVLGNPGAFLERVTGALQSLPEILRGGSTTSLVEAMQTPQQREALGRLTAVMTLLEGHADVVMDEAGPDVIPTVPEIRRRFNDRRKGAGMADKLLRRLLGLEAKARQYRDGARFVRAAVKEVGMDGFNRVWESPETLPRPTEIITPKDWVRRVHG